ncbi:hypothetical protein G7Y89_g8401 [Cudoniella acicularis]|uniref:Carboxymuconolactone decarboxylase-like domain-containing protein n=1 Tax=Cudoniella acicularis TaxID=354080 RepID=A0A8H4W0M9_9HELO|nr:hypothetical protein G7Y89_g8401 [Cudoniella acicularis]
MPLRFPTTDLVDQSSSQAIQQELRDLHHGEPPFRYKRGDGNLIGCYATLSYSPDMLAPFFKIARAVYSPKNIDAYARELCILAVASVHSDPYVIECHIPLALKAGLSQLQIDEAVAGNVPHNSSEEHRAIYGLARRLIIGGGPLTEEEWQNFSGVLGRQKVLGIAHVVGSYLYGVYCKGYILRANSVLSCSPPSPDSCTLPLLRVAHATDFISSPRLLHRESKTCTIVGDATTVHGNRCECGSKITILRTKLRYEALLINMDPPVTGDEVPA